MRHSIYKYPMTQARQEFLIPGLVATRPRLVAMQNGVPTLWLEVDLDNFHQRSVTYQIYGTGHEISDEEAFHVGSVVDGMFVWHVYQVSPEEEDE